MSSGMLNIAYSTVTLGLETTCMTISLVSEPSKQSNPSYNAEK